MDGCHIRYHCPIEEKHAHFNYKHFHSFTLHAVVDQEYVRCCLTLAAKRIVLQGPYTHFLSCALALAVTFSWTASLVGLEAARTVPSFVQRRYTLASCTMQHNGVDAGLEAPEVGSARAVRVAADDGCSDSDDSGDDGSIDPLVVNDGETGETPAPAIDLQDHLRYGGGWKAFIPRIATCLPIVATH